MKLFIAIDGYEDAIPDVVNFLTAGNLLCYVHVVGGMRHGNIDVNSDFVLSNYLGASYNPQEFRLE